MIKLNSLNKFYNKGKENEIHVVNDVSLELPYSGMVAIFGKSGCGKTTLLNLIGGLDKYDSGTLTIDGNGSIHKNDAVRNEYIGYIFQNYNLDTARTCRENVSDALYLCGFTDKELIDARVNEALAAVGMEKYRDRRTANLSGGQQQRIAIARAIVKNPHIILADEPTGNLDESNTVMVMNLLREISKDRLVLIVTHENNLVDHYCDKVIELSDGKIVGVRDNLYANGYSAPSRSDIYLGELNKEEITTEYASIEYYGSLPKDQIKLKIINTGGTIYLKAETDGIKLIDSSSEIKVHEGVFEEKPVESAKSVTITELPSINPSRTGKMFTLSSSIKSGFRSAFKSGGKVNKLLIACMILFSANAVFTSSVFGTAIRDAINIDRSYNHNTFYVMTNNGEDSDKLLAAVGNSDTGIDFITLKDASSVGDERIFFDAGKSFETFYEPSTSESYNSNAVFLSSSLANGKDVLAGKGKGLSEEEILISRHVADLLLKNSTLGYISEYRDLIGLTSGGYGIGGMKMRIAGVVDSDEPAIYLTDMAMAKYALANSDINASCAPNGISVGDGEVVLISDDSTFIPEATVTIHGKEFTVKDVMYHFPTGRYGDWLVKTGVEKLMFDEFMTDITATRYPSLPQDTPEFDSKLDEVSDVCYYDYIEYYYDRYEEFLQYSYITSSYPEMELWLYAEKGVKEAVLELFPEPGYYEACVFKAEHGRYPSRQEMQDVTAFKTLDESYIKLYEQEYYNTVQMRQLPHAYVSENDFITLSKRVGKTDKLLEEYSYSYYTLIHSSDTDATSLWIEENLGSSIQVITPSDIRDTVAKDYRDTIIIQLVSMITTLADMSVCMYFIMRSSLMSRIKVIGIYRAIGASKSNLRFKFLIEALVLASLTVIVGYILASGFIFAAISSSPAVGSVMFYPVWYALVILLLLVSITALCGIIPISTLLRKTPSEIIAKYDI